ncbi:MAG: hypothetical protein ACR2MS_11085 [Weeksellaceae bacterium]
MPYKKIVYTFCLLVGMVHSMQAQEGTINGLIVIDFKDENPEGVVVTNKQTNKAVISSLTGSFKIQASVGDTLYFKGSFLEERKLAVRNVHFKYNPVIVHMNHEVITLEDIVVRPPLTGDLNKDIASVKRNEEIEELYARLGIDIRTRDIDPKEKEEDIIPKWGGIPIPTSINVQALYKSLTGYYRKMENLNKFETLDKQLKEVIDYFGEDYFTQTLGIKKGKSLEFMLYLYGLDPQKYQLYYQQNEFLSLDQLMRTHASQFNLRLKQTQDSIK